MRIRNKVLIGLIILIAALAFVVSTSSGADPYLDVHHMVDDPERHDGQIVSVKGLVLENSTVTDNDTIRFVIADQNGSPEHAHKNITVVYAGVLPDAFGPKMVVVTGELIETPQGLRIVAEDIQVGCSSKY